MVDLVPTGRHRGEPRLDMLYASTGRSLLGMVLIAVVAVGGLIVMVALWGGAPWGSQNSPRWDWALAFTVSDRLGAAVLRNSWSVLSFFATVLVAVALAGRGLFSSRLLEGGADDTVSGLRIGAFDGRASIHLVGRVAMFSGLYLAIVILLIVTHLLSNVDGSRVKGQWELAATVLPLMGGGVVLCAHIGVFVTGVEVRSLELGSLKEKLSQRCQEIATRVAPVDESPELVPSGIAWIFVRSTASLALVPCLVLTISAFLSLSWGTDVGNDVVVLLLTLGTAAVTVMTPWMTDVLDGWTDRIFRVWWIGLLVSVHLVWMIGTVGATFTSSAHSAALIVVAAVGYVLQIIVFTIHYRRIRRAGSDGRCLLISKVSPFLAVDRIVLHDRTRQRQAVDKQLRELEARGCDGPSDRSVP